MVCQHVECSEFIRQSPSQMKQSRRVAVSGSWLKSGLRVRLPFQAQRVPDRWRSSIFKSTHLPPRGSALLLTSAKTDSKESLGDTNELNLRREDDLPAWSGDYTEGDVLGGKYRVQEVIGRGSNGVTYKATGPDGKEVAVKALSLRRMTGWKQLELFEREAKILESLSHPGIPQYIDYFEEDSKQDRGFFLVQELAQGKSLADLVEGGWRADEAEVRRIAVQILNVLEYLSSRRPPVVHRDVKPENIVLEGGKAGGRVFLVDFGGVQAAAASESFGMQSTIIGTYGYMAPEQFRGAAQPASDLYGLGGTLLYLLSGKPPNAFPQDRMQIEFKGVIDVDPQLSEVLEGLLEPVIEDRMLPANAAALLTGKSSPAVARAGDQPAGAVAKIREKQGKLRIDIPPAPVLSPDKIGLAGFAVTWNVGIGVWTASAVAAGSVFAAAFSLPFWAAGFSVAKEAFRASFREERIDLNQRTWSITRSGRFAKKESGSPAAQGKTRDLKGAQVVVTGYVNGVASTEIKLVEGFREHRFGSGLSTMEQQWIATKIMSYLQNLPGQPPPSIAPRQKSLGEEITQQAHRRVRQNLRSRGIDWPRENGGYIEDDMWRISTNPSNEYEAAIAWEDDDDRPQSSPAKDDDRSGRDAQKSSSFGTFGTDPDPDSLTTDDLGLVSHPDDSIAADPDSSDKD